jgi:hypothetical protein
MRVSYDSRTVSCMRIIVCMYVIARLTIRHEALPEGTQSHLPVHREPHAHSISMHLPKFISSSSPKTPTAPNYRPLAIHLQRFPGHAKIDLPPSTSPVLLYSAHSHCAKTNKKERAKMEGKKHTTAEICY